MTLRAKVERLGGASAGAALDVLTALGLDTAEVVGDDARPVVVDAKAWKKAIHGIFTADQGELARLRGVGLPDIPTLSGPLQCPKNVRPVVEAELRAVLTALYPGGVRRAKAVGRVERDEHMLIIPSPGEGFTNEHVIGEGDLVAILDEEGV
jgi:hypothetical protein